MADETRLVVPETLHGARVDKAIAELLGVSRSTARQLVERGVTVSERVVDASEKVDAGAVIMTPIPEVEPELEAEPLEFGVLYEDEHLLVIDKPPGVVVHPGTGRTRGTLAGGLLHRYPDIAGVGDPGRWGLIHRLDRDTSGALLVARDDDTYRALVSDLKHRRVRRVYLALVHGLVGSATGTIDAPIGRDPTRPMKQALNHDGRPARTHYELLRLYTESDCSLLRVTLETGRTHQIRVHLAAIDHPVVGDFVYDPRPHRTEAPRTFLHAAELGFTHPITGEHMEVRSPLPADLQDTLDALG